MRNATAVKGIKGVFTLSAPQFLFFRGYHFGQFHFRSIEAGICYFCWISSSILVMIPYGEIFYI